MRKRESTGTFNAVPLLFTTLVISICSIVYELIIGSLSSYLLGDSVTQFSITIGLFLFSMGIGSYLSKYISRNLFDYFAAIEIGIGILGGFSSLMLFFFYIYSSIYPLAMYVCILLIGLLVGLEIPLLVRIIQENQQSLKNSIANLFAFDYIGGLIGSIVFPVLLLPKLGYITVAFFTGLLNLAAAALIVFNYRERLSRFRLFRNIACICLLVVFLFMMFGQQITTALEGGLYKDQIIYTRQTMYQKIVLTKHKDDLRLFLDGNLQFSSIDEYRYHEALVHVPMAVAPHAQKVLLLGAGDGLAARELLKYESITNITLVDIDQQLLDLCMENPLIRGLNEDSLKNPKVTLVAQDAFVYLQETDTVYDVIIADLPDPNNEALNKLYTTAFYRLCKSRLAQDGIFVTQSSSPFFTGRAFWCINKTLAQEFYTVVPYHLYVPTFGDWGFNLASNTPITPEQITLPKTAGLRYLTAENFDALFFFGQDEKKDMEQLEVNQLLKPTLINYYIEDTLNW